MNSAKVLGAILGFTLGMLFKSPQVAVLLAVGGAVIGHLFDSRAEEARRTLPHTTSDPSLLLTDLPPPRTRAEIEREARSLFALHVASLFHALARADGRRDDVHTRAAQFLQQKLAFNPEDVASLTGHERTRLRSPEDAARVCREELSAPERMLLLDALYGLAMEDGKLSRSAHESLLRLAQQLGLSEAEHASVSRLYVRGKASDYALLGISAHATDEEVKRAFRRLAAEHHPDKVNHLGGTAVFRASETFRAIREAYEAILAARGRA